VPLGSLLRDVGGTESCGCAQRDWIAERNRTHGLSDHPLFNIWQGMLQRCYYEGHPGYKNYGGRGVIVCDRWRDDVHVFIEDIEREIGPRPEGKYEKGRPLYELDRIDNDGNYEPGNVRWLTISEQRLNSRRHLEAVQRGHRPEGFPTRLVPRHLRNHALRAISQRLGPGGVPAEHCLLAIERAGDAVIIRVNSGGNALAVEPYLRWQGYCVEFAGSNPGGYGCAVRVTLRDADVSAIGRAIAHMKDHPGLSYAQVAEQAGVSLNVARKARTRLNGGKP
jgi:hypothetical protein